jgi:hypothetical protein
MEEIKRLILHKTIQCKDEKQLIAFENEIIDFLEQQIKDEIKIFLPLGRHEGEIGNSCY